MHEQVLSDYTTDGMAWEWECVQQQKYCIAFIYKSVRRSSKKLRNWLQIGTQLTVDYKQFNAHFISLYKNYDTRVCNNINTLNF